MRHRIFLVEPRRDRDPLASQAHWRESHSATFAANPGLIGYVQDRPLVESLHGIGYRFCSETWFPDASAERDGFASAYYLQTVVPDELKFVERQSVWTGLVSRIEETVPGPLARYRALLFGEQTVPPAARVTILHLDRVPPGGALPQIVSAWTEDRAQAMAMAQAATGIAFAAEPRAVVRPPQPNWG